MQNGSQKHLELTQQELIRAAEDLGVEVDLLQGYATDNILLRYKDQSVLFCSDGTPLHQFNYQAFEIARNKQLCKYFLDEINLPFPASMVFKDFEQSKPDLKQFMQIGQTYVCKPLSGAEGSGVCMNLNTIAEVEQAYRRWHKHYQDFILEQQLPGSDLRMQAIDGQLVAACIRKPASVVGDGLQNLQALIDDRAQAVKAQNPANHLEIDTASMELIKAQGLHLNSIPEKGKQVQLKSVANMSQGALALDITEEIHPEYSNWVARVAKHLGLYVFALDVLTLDYKQAPQPGTAWVLEVNGKPYWYHHTFTEVRQHDIASLLIRDTFKIV